MGVVNALARLSRPSGGFAMVAIDQREALRGMLAKGMGVSADSVEDGALIDFKVSAASHLSPHASALLMDAQWGAGPVLDAKVLDSRSGMIVAVDRLVGPKGGAATATEIDETVDVVKWRDLGADAFKFLVFWSDDRDLGKEAEMTERFIQSCRLAGVPAVLEVIVRPPSSNPAGYDMGDGLTAAAAWSSGFGPDLYKAQVPYYGEESCQDAQIISCSRAITNSIHCPWVVLSNGVKAANFSRAVRLSCAGGASGFLAGRAVWADVVESGNYLEGLEKVSVPRLTELTRIVDECVKTRDGV